MHERRRHRHRRGRRGEFVDLVAQRSRDVGRVNVQPRMQRRAHVEAARGERLEEFGAGAFFTGQRHGDHRAVALGSDAFVPVVIGPRTPFVLDEAEPRVFARRLVEVKVESGDRCHLALSFQDEQ